MLVNKKMNYQSFLGMSLYAALQKSFRYVNIISK